MAKAAAQQEICSAEVKNSILNVLNTFGLPTGTDTDAQTLYNYALSDKKRAGNFVNLIIPEKIGYCRIQKTPVDQLLSFIKAGL